MTLPTLHSYYRSSTSYRLRIALNLKGMKTIYQAHHLRHGEQRRESYLKINSQGLIPSLVLPSGEVLTQSLAIIEYLEETIPEPPLLPKDPVARAKVRAMAQMIACEIHPLNNLRILKDLKSRFGADDEMVAVWFRHWVTETFKPLELMLAGRESGGDFCAGDTPGLADICLVAQVANNSRFQLDMTPYPAIIAIYDTCMALPAFRDAAPAKQPDAE